MKSRKEHIGFWEEKLNFFSSFAATLPTSLTPIELKTTSKGLNLPILFRKRLTG